VALYRRIVRDRCGRSRLIEAGIAPDTAALRVSFDKTIDDVFAEATLQRPGTGFMQTGGRDGRHSEHLGFILTELQFLQRAYPGAKW
jgi:ring-1,2-phenylacetyl-CoA epoxidase subunit PaaC